MPIRLPAALAVFVLATATAASGAHAQNADLPATYGYVALDGGFTYDPYYVSLYAGGTIPDWCTVDSYHFADAPDFKFDYNPVGYPLTILAESSVRVAILVEDPSGNSQCNSTGANQFQARGRPYIHYFNPKAGTYAVWIGTQRSGNYPDAELIVSERGPQYFQ